MRLQSFPVELVHGVAVELFSSTIVNSEIVYPAVSDWASTRRKGDIAVWGRWEVEP